MHLLRQEMVRQPSRVGQVFCGFGSSLAKQNAFPHSVSPSAAHRADLELYFHLYGSNPFPSALPRIKYIQVEFYPWACLVTAPEYISDPSFYLQGNWVTSFWRGYGLKLYERCCIDAKRWEWMLWYTLAIHLSPPPTPIDHGLYHNSGQFSLPSSLPQTSYTALSIIVSIFDLAGSIMIRWERWGKQKIPFPKSPCSEDLWVKRSRGSLPHYV